MPDLTDGNLTAVCLVGLVGAVRDAVTLWVDLGDAGGGAALEVSAAVRQWKTWRRHEAAVGSSCPGDARIHGGDVTR